MFDKLEELVKKFEELTRKSADPDVLADINEWKKITKERADLEDIVEKYLEYKKVKDQLSSTKTEMETEKDSEMYEMLYEETRACEEKIEAIIAELKMLLLPKDPNDDKNVIVEIRAGAGGDEAGLFGYELYKMYIRYAEKSKMKYEPIDVNLTEAGGVKEVVFSLSGKGAYSKLKFESGVHRVQRVPETENQGRVHTSTVTVAVLPEAEDVDMTIEEKDLKIDTYRSSGAGGQKVNKTESAIRITHIPTGIIVNCQDERSQTKNKEKAMNVLKSRIYDYYSSINDKAYSENRKSQIGTGDRSERIRTYNFPQGRVTDHRIGLTLHSLDQFMLGDIDEMIEALAIANKNAQLMGEKI